MIDPRTFMDSVLAYVQSQQGRASRIATIDDTYTTGLPRVIFDGDEDLSIEGFEYLRPYVPAASDRVIMLPIGTTYVIAGSLGG